MTTGNPWKLIFVFMLPLAIGNIFQQLYSMVDTIIVGQFVGVSALAAVGATGGLMFFVMGMVQGAAAGFTIVTSQRFGAGDEKGVRSSVAHCIILSVVYTLLLTVISLAMTGPIMQLINTPDDIYEDAVTYIRIIFIGYAATMLYNLTAGILRAMGDSRRPLYFLLISTGLNIVLDLVFILVFHMGVAGAAWATVLAQLVAGLLCLWYMARNYPILKLSREDFSWSWHFAGEHLKIGLPMAFQFSVIAIGILFVQRAVNAYGTAAVAGYTAGNKVELLLQQPMIALGTAMATYCGQNLGARRYDRIRKGMLVSLGIGLGCCVFALIFNLVAGRAMTSLFIDAESVDDVEEVLWYGTKFLQIALYFYIPLQFVYIFRSSLQGLGDGINPFVGSTIELVARAVFSIWLPPLIGYIGVAISAPLAWLGAGVYLIIVFYIRLGRMEKRVRLEA